VETFLADGRLDEAESEVQSHPFDPQLGAQVRRRLRHRMLRRVAILELVGFFGLAGVRIAGVRARRAGGPLRRAENARRASARGAFAVGFALLCCVSVVAAVFVCLDAINAKYLASFGL
jgi:hypothetical protein